MDANKTQNSKNHQNQTKKLFTQKTPEARKKQFFKIAMALAIVIFLILLYKSFANINTRTASNISLNYDTNTIKENNGKIECIKDDRILQWHEGLEMWECKKLTSSVFGELDKHNVKVNDSGNLECKEDNKALIWEDDQWACGDVVGNITTEDGLSISSSDQLSIDSPTCTSTEKLIWNGESFQCVEENNNFWAIGGNSNIDDNINFIGTLNNQDLVFKTDGENYLTLTTKGQLEFENDSNSIFIGKDSGDNDDGSDNENTFIGYEAGKENTSGRSNTVLGYDAFSNSTTSIENTLIGYEAGANLTTGSYNVAVGERAMSDVDTGQENTAVGHISMDVNTGSQNASMGHFSARGGAKDKSVALGVSAERSSRGNYVGGIFIGSVTGRDLTTGKYNTFIGAWSGIICSTGENNIIINGGSATNDLLTTNSRNIVIGNNIRIIPGTQGVDNQLNIANIIYGKNIDGIGNTVSSGNIGIGNYNPSARLHIKGVGSTNSTASLKISNSNDQNILIVQDNKAVFTYGSRTKSYAIKNSVDTITNSDTEIIYGDTDGGVFTLTLPPSPTDGIIFSIKNIGTSGNNLTIDRNGNIIDGLTSSLTLIDNDFVKLQYTSDGWKKI